MSTRTICRRSVVPSLLVLLAACSSVADSALTAPTDPTLGKGKPSTATSPRMTISPTTADIAVGSTTTVRVTYFDAKGNAVPDTDTRLTYYGCVPVAPAGATCNDLLLLTPTMPSLREAGIQGLAAGQARIYATDGLGTYVWAELTIQ